jgi:hypothetical protein
MSYEESSSSFYQSSSGGNEFGGGEFHLYLADKSLKIYTHTHTLTQLSLFYV